MLMYTSIQEVTSMKVLFIGGTGTISSAIVRNLAEEGNWDIWLINRGNRNDILPDGVHQIIADINDEKTVADAIRILTVQDLTSLKKHILRHRIFFTQHCRLCYNHLLS